MRTQNLIISSYFDKAFENISNLEEVENYRRKLYTFKDYLGCTEGYTFFNDYYVNKMEQLENKYNEETIFKDFYDSIRNLENEILDFSAKKKYDSITKQIIKAVKEENPKEIYRAPMFQNLLIKLYIKFLKK